MGLPEININFQSLAVSAIQRSQRGIVALILKDDTGAFDTKEYKAITDIDPLDWTETNRDYIEKAMLGVPSKIIVERINVADLDHTDGLTRLTSKVFNYLAIPEIVDVANVSTWTEGQRDNEKKTFKAVLPNSLSDHEGVINFATEGIVVGEMTYTAAEYTARIAGLLAGLSLERSSTYFVLPEVNSITESEDPDADIDAGKLILINDGEKIKIGRGVNSLTTTTDKSDDWKKIKIIEGHDLIKEDISKTFNDDYVGKVNNSYDNQVLFLAAVNAYIAGLEGTVLNPNVENIIGVDIEKQRQAWESVGTDTSDWDDQKVKENSFQSKVFAGGSVRFLDAMEDLDFKIIV